MVLDMRILCWTYNLKIKGQLTATLEERLGEHVRIRLKVPQNSNIPYISSTSKPFPYDGILGRALDVFKSLGGRYGFLHDLPKLSFILSPADTF